MNRGQVNLEDGGVRHTVEIKSEECAARSPEARYIQYRMLDLLSQSQDLTRCGEAPFDELHMRHDGTTWVVEVGANAAKKA